MSLLPANLGADQDPNYLQYYGVRKLNGKRIPLAIRQINPGAIKFVNGNKWVGKDWEPEIDVSNINGRHEVFFRPEFGIRAQTHLIKKRIVKESRNTLGLITSKYAPADYDGNDPNAYAVWLSKRLNWDINARLEFAPEHVAPLLAAMNEYESGWKDFWSKRQITDGVNMGMGITPRHAYPPSEYERPVGESQTVARVPMNVTPAKPKGKPAYEPEPATIVPKIRKRANKAIIGGGALTGGAVMSKANWVYGEMFATYSNFISTVVAVTLFMFVLAWAFLRMREINVKHESGKNVTET